MANKEVHEYLSSLKLPKGVKLDENNTPLISDTQYFYALRKRIEDTTHMTHLLGLGIEGLGMGGR